jgi:hypothetical protein
VSPVICRDIYELSNTAFRCSFGDVGRHGQGRPANLSRQQVTFGGRPEGADFVNLQRKLMGNFPSTQTSRKASFRIMAQMWLRMSIARIASMIHFALVASAPSAHTAPSEVLAPRFRVQ